MNKMNEFIEALRNGKAYDWISRHGHELNKYELIDIIKEYEYARSNMNDELAEDLFKDFVADNLNELYEDEDYEED